MSWWEDAVGYEVYLRSYADSDDNGIGDFAGLTGKLEYIAGLGVDAVWVTPFYPSPQADFGYDVADYKDVDPIYGTLDDFDTFVARAHDLGLKVVLDIVPNHSSSQHPLFQAALEGGPGSEHWDYYVWRDPAPDGGLPNNWFSIFGGPAWTYVAEYDKYYMHLFLPEQPDLNWANPAVRDEFLDILRFWVDRGVDGFRIDVAHSLVEDQSFADNPYSAELEPGYMPEHFGHLEHLYDLDQPETPDVFRSWREAVGPDVFLVGEVYLAEPEKVRKYVVDGALHQSFYFTLNGLAWDPVEFVRLIREAADTVPGGWAWVQGSHDEHRNVTRYGNGQTGIERSLALWVAMMGLPGTPFLYQGEELGLENGEVVAGDVLDPVGLWQPSEGRDPCRTPMPWAIEGPTHGFSQSASPWLVSQRRPDHETIEYQESDDESPLAAMRALLTARRATAAGRSGQVRWIESPDGTIAYSRDGVAHLANLSDHPVELNIESKWRPAHDVGGGRIEAGRAILPPRSALILEKTE